MTSRSFSMQEQSPRGSKTNTKKSDVNNLWPYLGIEIPGIGYEATTHAKREKEDKQAASGA